MLGQLYSIVHKTIVWAENVSQYSMLYERCMLRTLYIDLRILYF